MAKFRCVAVREYYSTAEVEIIAETYDEADDIFRDMLDNDEVRFSGVEPYEDGPEVDIRKSED